MKTLELNQMENLEAGGGFALGFFCSMAILGAAVAITTTAGLATVAVATAISLGGAGGCGWNIGDTIENGL